MQSRISVVMALFSVSCPTTPNSAPEPKPGELATVANVPDKSPALTLPVKSVAVLPIRAKGNADKKVLEALDGVLLSAFQNLARGQLKVVGKSDIDTSFGLEKAKDALGCEELACAAAIAGALGVESVVSATAGTLGKQYVLTLTWIDQKKAEAIARQTETLGESQQTLESGAKAAVARLLVAGSPVQASPIGGTIVSSDSRSPIRTLAAGVAGRVPSDSSTSPGANYDEFAKRIFLGQAYPSGNVYLVPFPLPTTDKSEGEYRRNFQWPKAVTFHGFRTMNAAAKRLRKGDFVGVMHDELKALGPNSFTMLSAYIPSLESMDDSHEGCTKEFYKPRKPEYLYLGTDFFEQVLFNCIENEGVSIYKFSDASVWSFNVVAFEASLNLANVVVLDGTKHRPLTKAEKQRVAREKREHKKDAADCTTVPTFLDGARLLLAAGLEGSDIVLRLSSYQNAGCGGHLAEIYILDLLQGEDLRKSYELVQSKGGI